MSMLTCPPGQSVDYCLAHSRVFFLYDPLKEPEAVYIHIQLFSNNTLVGSWLKYELLSFLKGQFICLWVVIFTQDRALFSNFLSTLCFTQSINKPVSIWVWSITHSTPLFCYCCFDPEQPELVTYKTVSLPLWPCHPSVCNQMSSQSSF